MAFTQKLPEWNAPGVEPSATQKQTGFQPGMKPPAQWFNWHLNWSYLALKELQEKAVEKSYVDTLAGELREEIGNADIPPASLTVAGKVKLSNKIDGDSESIAPTEKALNDARLAAQKYTDEKTWQKYKLTEDNGSTRQLALGYNLNDLVTSGYYFISGPANAPAISQTFYVEVIVMNTLVLQRATQVYTGLVYLRVNGGSWTPWVLQTPQPNVWGAL